ncbi:MAG: hypothetical protein AAF518_05050 [Spirochaetota bacterium]
MLLPWKPLKQAIIAVIFTFIFSNCFIKGQSTHKENQKVTEDPLEELYLLVSNEHKNHLVHLEKNLYKTGELQKVFNLMQTGSDAFCNMIYGRKKHDEKVSDTFIRSDYYKKLHRTHGQYIPKLVAGCRNFFKMNDLNPHRDFELVKKLYPNASKECYSVGFMQPYLMHQILGCRKLTMLDIDWKILDGHRQMIQKFKKKEFANKENVSKNLTSLDIGWIPNFNNEPIQEKEDVSIDTVCFRYYSPYCTQALFGFQERFEELESVQLQLSSLHNGLFIASPGSMVVIFLSNATDKLYTSWEEFKLFLDSVYGTLSEGQSALFIYHNAGRSNFGLYEMKKTSVGKSIETICRDEYLYPRSYTVQGTYITFFEYITQSKGRNKSCSGMKL